jgi:hypothetical protein
MFFSTNYDKKSPDSEVKTMVMFWYFCMICRAAARIESNKFGIGSAVWISVEKSYKRLRSKMGIQTNANKTAAHVWRSGCMSSF